MFILMGFDCKNLSGKYFINTMNAFIILSFIMPLFVCKQFHFLLIYTADNYTLESGDNQRSRCLVSVLLMTKKFVLTNNSVSFDYRVDSRDCRNRVFGCDGLGFFIDSQQVLQYQGNQFRWVTKTYNLKKVSLNQTLPADSVMLHKTVL